jgi:hypothetical protein
VIAVVGAGQEGIAALIDTIVAIAYLTPAGAPATTVVVIDARERPPPRGDTPYPLEGRNAADMHPFNADEPPEGFQTFGAWVKEQVIADPSLRDALRAPTHRQVNQYLDDLLELAATSFPLLVSLDVNQGTIREVEQTTVDGPAIIHFVDGTTLSVMKLVRATRRPHMAGPGSGDPMGNEIGLKPRETAQASVSALTMLRAQTECALVASGLVFKTLPSHFNVAVRNRNICIVTLDLPSALLGERVAALLTRLEVIHANEMWIVTAYTVDEQLRSRFNDAPVRLLSLSRYDSLLELMKSLATDEAASS